MADHCWDERSGFYYDIDGTTGELRTFVKHVGGFIPLLLGLPSREDAERMVKHLENPAEFWTRYPVPSISRDSPEYSPSGYWHGCAWPSFNFIIVRGLLNYGFLESADRLLERWLAHTATCFDPVGSNREPFKDIGAAHYDAREAIVPDITWIVPENWNPETGAVHSSGGMAWGGLWLPSVIMRNFWPIDEGRALVRPGGRLTLKCGDQWDVSVGDRRGSANGRSFRMRNDSTYLLDRGTGALRELEPGRADPPVFDV